jgi:hypothetical protein
MNNKITLIILNLVLMKICYKIINSFSCIASCILIGFILSNIGLYAQHNTDHLKYSPAKQYSKNVLSTFFANLETANGTEIAPNHNKKLPLNKKVETENGNKRDSLGLRESEDQERILVCIKLQDYDRRIGISVYNMLAKKVLDVYDGQAKKDECPYEYTIYKSKLPNGVYLCVVTGDKLKLVDKFIISR